MTSGGIRFDNEIGPECNEQTMASATNFIWRVFRQKWESDRKNVTHVGAFIDDISGIAYPSNDEIHFSAGYIESYQGDVKRNLRESFTMRIEMTHIWQWDGSWGTGAPGGLIEGIADFIRLKAGYGPAHWVEPGQGDRPWDQGYDVTAYFLDYCNALRKGFVARLNKKMRQTLSDEFFVELLGKSVDQLWME